MTETTEQEKNALFKRISIREKSRQMGSYVVRLLSCWRFNDGLLPLLSVLITSSFGVVMAFALYRSSTTSILATLLPRTGSSRVLISFLFLHIVYVRFISISFHGRKTLVLLSVLFSISPFLKLSKTKISPFPINPSMCVFVTFLCFRQQFQFRHSRPQLAQSLSFERQFCR